MNGQMDEFDEKEKERRKNDQLAYRKIQKNSNMFLFFGTLFEIALSFLLVLAIIIIAVTLCIKVFKFSDDTMSVVYQIIIIAGFIGGLALGFFLYKKIGRWVINKWNLKDKLREDVLMQFKTFKEYKEYVENKKNR